VRWRRAVADYLDGAVIVSPRHKGTDFPRSEIDYRYNLASASHKYPHFFPLLPFPLYSDQPTPG